jgi:hypothetical protein
VGALMAAKRIDAIREWFEPRSGGFVVTAVFGWAIVGAVTQAHRPVGVIGVGMVLVFALIFAAGVREIADPQWTRISGEEDEEADDAWEDR